MQTKYTLMAAASALILAAGVSEMALAERGPMGAEGGPAAMMGLNFEAMDADKDGKLTEAEITAFRTAELAAADADKDGKLNAAELVALQETRMQERKAAMAARMIERMDSDGDGLVSVEEMAAGPQMPTMFERVDADGDGAVTLAELDAAREKMTERRGRHGPRGDHGHGMRGMEDGPEMMPEN